MPPVRRPRQMDIHAKPSELLEPRKGDRIETAGARGQRQPKDGQAPGFLHEVSQAPPAPLPTIFDGSTTLSNCFSLIKPDCSAASLSVSPSSLALWAMADALSYPMTGLSAVTSISERPTSSSMCCRLSFVPSTWKVRNFS